MSVILISAKAGHGKNQYRDFIKQRLQQNKKNVTIIAFRDLLKNFCDDIYQKLKPYFKNQYIFDKIDNNIKNDQKGMEFARRWWLAVGRYTKKHFGGLVWVNSLFTKQFQQKYLYYPEYKQNFAIIPDMRFKNEVEFCKNHAFNDKIKLIRIWRPGDHPIAGYLGTAQKFVSDKSQTDLDDITQWQRLVLNDKGIEDLKKDAYNFVDILLK